MFKPILRLFLTFSLILANSGTAVSSNVSNSDTSVSITDNPGFIHFNKTLKLIVRDRAPTFKGKHHFYVAKYKSGDNLTYMLWREGRKLWILTPGNQREETWLSIRYPSSGQLIDLDKDVVKTDKDVGTSTYLVSRPWVNDKIYAAVVNGDLIIISN